MMKFDILLKIYLGLVFFFIYFTKNQAYPFHLQKNMLFFWQDFLSYAVFKY